MFANVLKNLFKSRYGAYLIVALLLIGAAYGGKVYYEMHAAPEAERAATGVEEYLGTVEDALSRYASAQKEGESPFPPNAEWTPAVTECGTAVNATESEKNNPTWKALALPLDSPTRYQFRFRSRASAWHLIARTDSDCDGIYKVFHLRGTSGWEGVGTGPLKIDNPGE